MSKEFVLVLFKPDVMAKGLMGHVLSRFNEIDVTLVAMKLVVVSRELAEQHYCHLKDKPFYRQIVDYLQGKMHGSPKVAVFVFAGLDAIARCRELAGATNPEDADPKTIRGSLGRITTKGVYENLLHVSSDEKESRREIALWFTPDEIGEDVFPTKKTTITSHSTRTWA